MITDAKLDISSTILNFCNSYSNKGIIMSKVFFHSAHLPFNISSSIYNDHSQFTPPNNAKNYVQKFARRPFPRACKVGTSAW